MNSRCILFHSLNRPEHSWTYHYGYTTPPELHDKSIRKFTLIFFIQTCQHLWPVFFFFRLGHHFGSSQLQRITCLESTRPCGFNFASMGHFVVAAPWMIFGQLTTCPTCCCWCQSEPEERRSWPKNLDNLDGCGRWARGIFAKNYQSGLTAS